MVAREDELALLDRLVRSGETAGAVVTGDVGVGKTRVASAALYAAESGGLAGAWATATRAAASIPFGALAHLLPVPVDGPGGQLELLRRAGRALSERAGGRRLMLVVDDGHLLDDASATLIHQLGATRTAFVLVTVRAGEPVPDPIVAIWKDGLGPRVEVEPLGREQARTLVEAALGGRIDGATMVALWEATHGNPLYLRELVTAGIERGQLIDIGGIWRAPGPIAPGARLVELVEGRLAELLPPDRQWLDLIASCEPVGADLLGTIGGADALARLRAAAVIAVHRSGRRVDVAAVHPLYGEVLRSQEPLSRSWLARLARALQDTGARRREDLLRLGTWRLEAGAQGPAQVLIAASHRAQGSFDPVLGERLASAAASAGGGFPAQIARAQALNGQARYAESDILLGELAPRATADAQRALIADLRASALFWGLGNTRKALHVLHEAEPQIADPEIRDELAAVRAAMLVFTGRPVEALAIARPILRRRRPEHRAAVRASLAAVTALGFTGGTTEATGLIAQVREPALTLTAELPFLYAQLLGAYCFDLALAGRLGEAIGEAEQGYERALAEHDHAARSIWAMALGHALLCAGALDRSRTLLVEAAAGFLELDPAGFRQLCLALLAHASALLGEPTEAENALEEAERVQRPGIHIFDPMLGLARVWAEAAAGATSSARAHAYDLAEQTATNGQGAFAAVALHDLARLGEPRPAAPRLALLVRRLDGPLPAAYAEHAGALAAGDASALDRAAGSFEASGALLLAAEAAAEASAAHRLQGKASSAARAAARSNLLAKECQGARTPALALVGDVAALTRREREIAALAAAGLSNRAIAAELVLSVRTVEHHIQHAYQKLGVSDRADLRELLHPA